MTSPDLLKIAAIKAILDAIEDGDEKDARQAMDLIRGLVEKAEK
jgi:DNA-binding FadR family transcriptional regulator